MDVFLLCFLYCFFTGISGLDGLVNETELKFIIVFCMGQEL